MRDIVVMLFLVGVILAAFKRPWLGVLGLAVFVYLNPHRYAWGFATTFPVYLVAFVGVFSAFVATGMKRQPLPKDWRVAVFFLLWGFYVITTIDAISMTRSFAWQKLIEVSKIYLPFLLMLWLIDTKEKLFWLLATIVGSIGLVAVKGGLFALATGFSYRVYGPNGTQFAENNAFGLAVLITIPLLVLLVREVTDKRLKWMLAGAVPLFFASALSSHSRGALLTLGVVAIALLWHSKRKWLIVPVAAFGIVWFAQNLPEHWFERMQTIETYEEDTSAMGRLEAWRDGINYALSNPLTGAGFDGWLWVTQRDWHSAYVEILAEHGFPGFLMWISLLYGSMFSLTRLAQRARHYDELLWVRNWAYMLRASLAAYAVGSLFLGLTYWTLLYHLIFLSVLVRKFANEEMAALEQSMQVRDASAAPKLSAGVAG